MDEKQYIGDGVYAAFDSSTLSVILTTEDGERTTNRIVLEPEVLDALGRFTQAAVYRRQSPTPAPQPDAAAIVDADAAAGASSITVVESSRPTIYPCGCSRLKVAAGLCSVYDADGSERSE